MSVVVTGKILWTQFEGIKIKEKNGKTTKVHPSTAKCVMVAIGDSADDFGENSYQSFETIAVKASIKRRSAIRVVRGLIQGGYLKVAGVSPYGTNNFSVNLEKLSNPPTKRSRIGRPKTSDSDDISSETSDSDAKTGDSSAKTSAPESPDPSLPVLKDREDAKIFSELESLVGPLNSNTPKFVDTWLEKHPVERIVQAIEVAREKGARSVKYVDEVLVTWEANGYPLTRDERIKAKRLNGTNHRQQAVPSESRNLND